jgi:hypothetical protein
MVGSLFLNITKKIKNYFMKMKILSLSALFVSLAIFFTACKKDNSNTSGNTDYTAELSVQADDQEQFSSEMDAIADDANTAVSAESSISGKVQSLICDATVTADTTGDPKTITITYDGTNCHGNRTRTGVVILSMPKSMHWKDQGAVLTITVQNLKITRIRDNKSITINGTKTITNVTGGLLPDLASHGTITHTINSDGMSVTFGDGTQRTWKIAEQRTFTYNNGIVITVSGTHTEGAATGILVWGTNRMGNAFSCAITDPLVVRQDCDFRLVSGTAVHTRSTVTATITFGLDANGNPVSCPSGSYYFKLVWVGLNGNSHTIIFPY